MSGGPQRGTGVKQVIRRPRPKPGGGASQAPSGWDDVAAAKNEVFGESEDSQASKEVGFLA